MAIERLTDGRRVVLLGPQQHKQNVVEAVHDLEIEGPLATVTAGWEEREGEDAELASDLGGRTRNLALYPRAEDVFTEDPDVRAILHERHDRLRELQTLYRLRLAAQLQTCRDLFARTDPAMPDALHGPEIDSAIDAIRTLDEHHLARTGAIDDEIAGRMAARRRPSLERHCHELAGMLDGVEALLIAGGHVGTLLNRLRLFDVLGLARTIPVIAWSGGAMVVAARVVLFHDSPPQGPGDPEVYAPGLALVRGVVPLPHAGSRLRLDDPGRVALFARRFAPDMCVSLDHGSRLDSQDGRSGWQTSGGARLLEPGGGVVEGRPT